jgi:polysaccharide pyruvyl transferase WcaK-like protein
LNEFEIFGDIRGGDSFSDIYGLRNFITGSLPCIICFLLGKRVILFPQTYGPYKFYLSRIMARLILKKASVILSRDNSSISLVKELLGTKAQEKVIRFCPDVAFCLEPNKSSSHPIVPKLYSGSNTVIGYNISGLLYNGGFNKGNMFGLKFDYKIFAQNLAERILRETNAKLLLVPHTFAKRGNVENDLEACEMIFSIMDKRFPGRVYRITQQCDQSELKKIIGLCGFFIGSRMHACIAAISQSIPTIGMAYSKKFSGVFESIGIADMVIDARFIDERSAIDQILEAFHKRSWETELVQKRVRVAQTILIETFEHLFGSEKKIV